MEKTYRVRVRATVDLIYEVEADSVNDAKEEAIAMAAAGDLPEEVEAADVGKAVVERTEE